MSNSDRGYREGETGEKGVARENLKSESGMKKFQDTLAKADRDLREGRQIPDTGKPARLYRCPGCGSTEDPCLCGEPGV